MGYIPDGWQRVLRKLEERAQASGYISLNVVSEEIGTVASNTWVSPAGAVQIGDAKNFEYIEGEIVYTGVKDVLVSVQTYQAISLQGGNTSDVEGTSGLNATPCEDFSMLASSSFGGVAVVVNQCVFNMTHGDTIDVYVKHHEPTDKIVTLNKAVYHVKVIDVL